MKTFLLSFAVLIATAACASNPHNAKYKEEKNQPKFGTSRSFVESPDTVKMAALAVLDELSRESTPPTTGSVKQDDEIVETGWVYAVSKDKYMEYTFNGTPRRKPLRVRRKYAYVITPSLAGSQVSLQVEEEVMDVDVKTGKEKGWKNVNPDSSAYEFLSRRLTEKLRSL